MDAASDELQVVAHQGLAAADDDEDLCGVVALSHTVEHAEEVLAGHVGLRRLVATVAATMAAVHIASQGALPEQLAQRMFTLQVLVDLACGLKGQPAAKFHGFSLFCFVISI